MDLFLSVCGADLRLCIVFGAKECGEVVSESVQLGVGELEAGAVQRDCVRMLFGSLPARVVSSCCCVVEDQFGRLCAGSIDRERDNSG